MKTLSFLISLLVVTPVFANNINPDAGRLTQIVCHGLTTFGDLSSRDPNFSIVITQEAIVDQVDASYFVPGNRNFVTEGDTGATFTIAVFKNANSLSTATDPQTYAEELLKNQPHLTYASSLAGRLYNTYTINLGEDANGSIDVNLDDQTHSAYDDWNVGDMRFLNCETPFSIPDPSAPAPAEVPQDQSAELSSGSNGVNSEL